MITLVFCARRLPSLSREDFQRYWHDVHGPLVRKYVRSLHIRSYVQLHTLEDPINAALRDSRGAPEPYDGVAEVSWGSREEFLAAFDSPDGQQASVELFEDERRFIDHARSPLWIATERPVVGR